MLDNVIVAGIDHQLIRYYFGPVSAQANVNAGVKEMPPALIEMQPVAFQYRI